MTPADVPDADRVSDAAYYELDVRTHRTGWPEPARRSTERSASWRARIGHVVRTDPGGCFVAEDAGGVLGMVAGMRRDLTFFLSSLAVLPGVQGRGVGRQLLDASLAYGAGCLRAMLLASQDPAALRRYRLAGFTLHPTLLLWGRVPREALPVVDRVRDGSAGDIDLMDSVDRQVRDAARGPDHQELLRHYRLVVSDRPTGSGYVYVDGAGQPYVLAATNRRTAVNLLWEALAASSPDTPVAVANVTPANEWAVDVGMACRMELWNHGYLGLRDMRPPVPFLPSGMFL
ncbi:MAG: GNAT family N-acetyltransferase [Nocardioidaceae bacterium]|nr:GNAT family N-acetyltransferase [Nocardioidaceae bacterium]NUS52266.1 GNAT family N-acetyltransferase [Nocardioidaceae bacterium]